MAVPSNSALKLLNPNPKVPNPTYRQVLPTNTFIHSQPQWEFNGS